MPTIEKLQNGNVVVDRGPDYVYKVGPERELSFRGDEIEINGKGVFRYDDIDNVIRSDGTILTVNPTGDIQTPRALMDELLENFFFRNVGSGGSQPAIPIENQVDTFADLPDAALNDGQYYIVNTSTGIPFINRREKGVYKAQSGIWDYKGPDIPLYFTDDFLTFSDSTDSSKQLGFEIDQISTGNKRIATWPDRNIFVLGIPNSQLIANSRYSIQVNSAGNDYSLRREFQDFAQSFQGLINQQDDVFEPFLLLTTDIPETGNYKLGFHYRFSNNTTTSNFQAHIVPDGSADPNDFIFPLHIESQDSAGPGQIFPIIQGGVFDPVNGPFANTGTDQFLLASGYRILEGLTAGTHTYLLEFSGQAANTETAIYEATITIERYA